MSIVTGELKYYLSGGAANTDPNLSLGGIISTTEVVNNTLHNLFDRVTGAESLAGDTEYRCIYVKNTNATLALVAAFVEINSQTTSPDTSLEIGLGTSAINGTEQTVANENTAPSGITFTAALSTPQTIGDMAAGAFKAIWIKRVVSSSAGAFANDTTIVNFQGETV